MSSDEEITAIRNVILDTVACERIYLFGSHAYGAPHNGSDYDFYVVLTDDAGNPLLAVENMYSNLRKIRNRKTPVDILAGHKTNFDERARLLTLENKIKNEGRVLYDRG